MAHVDTDGVVFAVAVTVSKQSNLGGIRRNLLNIDAKLVLGAPLFLPVNWILRLLVVESAGSCSRTVDTECHF